MLTSETPITRGERIAVERLLREIEQRISEYLSIPVELGPAVITRGSQISITLPKLEATGLLGKLILAAGLAGVVVDDIKKFEEAFLHYHDAKKVFIEVVSDIKSVFENISADVAKDRKVHLISSELKISAVEQIEADTSNSLLRLKSEQGLGEGGRSDIV